MTQRSDFFFHLQKTCDYKRQPQAGKQMVSVSTADSQTKMFEVYKEINFNNHTFLFMQIAH